MSFVYCPECVFCVPKGRPQINDLRPDDFVFCKLKLRRMNQDDGCSEGTLYIPLEYKIPKRRVTDTIVNVSKRG